MPNTPGQDSETIDALGAKAEEEKLAELLEKVARRGTGALGIPHGWDTDHERFLDAARDAIFAAADSGELKPWGVTERRQLLGLKIAVGFDSHDRVFLLDPEELAKLVRRAGLSTP